MSEIKYYKIHSLYDVGGFPRDEAPTTIDYETGLDVRLHPVFTWDKGRILRKEWHASFSLDANGEEVGTDLIVSEDFVYTEDASGLARSRTQSITWYYEDGTPGSSKVRAKVYGNAASRTEGRRRRRNVIDNMSIGVVGMYAATTPCDLGTAIAATKPYISALASEVSLYIEDGSTALATAISTDVVTAWLDNVIAAPSTTIRHYILGELS